MEPLTHKSNSKNPEWNESYYLCFSDKELSINGMSRIGFKPNKPEGMTFLFLFLPDGSAAGYHATNTIVEYSNPFTVESMVHEYVEKEDVWHYAFKGSLIVVENPEDFPRVREHPEFIKDIVLTVMDLKFKPLSNVYEYSEFMTRESLELGKKAGDAHWEQIALSSGNIELGDEIYTLKNAISQRDHTYGVRDWTGVGDWLYYVVWFSEKLAINPAAIIADDGRLSTGGFIFRDGMNIPLKEIAVKDQQFRDDGIFPVSSTLEIIDAKNQKYLLKGYPEQIIPVPFKDEQGNKSILIQSFGRFELNENKGGYGTFETLRRYIPKENKN